MKRTLFTIQLMIVGLGVAFGYSAIATAQRKSLSSSKTIVGDKFNPIWSKDGKLISFNNQINPSKSIIRLISPDGSRLRELFGQDGTISDISQNGRVLFRSADGSKVDDDEIYSMNLDGTGLKQLTNNDVVDQMGSWSPDGSRIAFITNRDGLWEVFLMNADGSEPSCLSKSPGAVQGARPPSWSPDGNWLLFHSNVDGDNEIYKIHPDGTELQKLTDNALNDFNPSFSPDGTKIAFISNRKGTKSQWDNRIFIMDADGSNQHQVGDATPIHGSLSWSPQDDQLAFNGFNGYEIEIFLIDTAGNQLRQLTHSPAQPLLETLKSKGIQAAQELLARRKQKNSLDGLFAFPSMQRLGYEYLGRKEFDKAIAAFKVLTEVFASESQSWNMLGEAYKDSGDKENAVRSLRKSLSLKPPPIVRDSSIALLKELGVAIE